VTEGEPARSRASARPGDERQPEEDVSNAQMRELEIDPEEAHGDWTYTVMPRAMK
jgi:hypothetical protein